MSFDDQMRLAGEQYPSERLDLNEMFKLAYQIKKRREADEFRKMIESTDAAFRCPFPPLGGTR